MLATCGAGLKTKLDKKTWVCSAWLKSERLKSTPKSERFLVRFSNGLDFDRSGPAKWFCSVPNRTFKIRTKTKQNLFHIRKYDVFEDKNWFQTSLVSYFECWVFGRLNKGHFRLDFRHKILSKIWTIWQPNHFVNVWIQNVRISDVYGTFVWLITNFCLFSLQSLKTNL